jgi:uncharacterized protein YbjT (DUF2867 family)
MRVLIFGATGFVGQGVLRECLLDTRVSEVVSVLRAPSGQRAPKLTEIVLREISKIEDVADQLAGYDACFFCLGVSSVGMSKAKYKNITFDLTITVARVLAPLNPVMTFIYVTGGGTSRNGWQTWSRVKALTEDILATLPFKAAYFFRPNFIQPLNGVVSKTRWYMAFYAVTRPLSPLLLKRFPNLATTTERLGQAMINVAAAGYPVPVLQSADINIAGTIH